MASLNPRVLAQLNPNMALQLGCLAMVSSSEESQSAGEILAKEGLSTLAARGEELSVSGADGLLMLLARGAEEWASPLQGWISGTQQSLRNLLARADEKGVEGLGRAFPEMMGNLPAEILAEHPEALRSYLRSERAEQRGIAAILTCEVAGAPRTAGDICAALAPKETALAWGRICARAAAPGGAETRTREIEKRLLGMTRGEARVAAEGIAEEMAQSRSLAILALLERIGEETAGRRSQKDRDPEGVAVFFEEIARELARREIGKRSISWGAKAAGVFPRVPPFSSGSSVSVAEAEAVRIADLPILWVFGPKGSSDSALGREELAMAWWSGWKSGGGDRPGIRILLRERPFRYGTKESGSGPKKIECGAETLALALIAHGATRAAKWLLCDSGWTTSQGLEEARGIERITRILGGFRMEAESEAGALMDAAAISMSVPVVSGRRHARGI